ncbi:GL15663 [Drosophila persimilis]|uniref:GL15663 n=2 Tax=Drosophila persimilis TaxID=7234 RepID=B4IRF3_DROPE|nr:GL15663 [Drosophila persimilis]
MKWDSYRHGVQSGQIQFGFRDRYMEVRSNDVEYYYVIGGLWLGGLILATVSFLCEFYLLNKV